MVLYMLKKGSTILLVLLSLILSGSCTFAVQQQQTSENVLGFEAKRLTDKHAFEFINKMHKYTLRKLKNCTFCMHTHLYYTEKCVQLCARLPYLVDLQTAWISWHSCYSSFAFFKLRSFLQSIFMCCIQITNTVTRAPSRKRFPLESEVQK